MTLATSDKTLNFLRLFAWGSVGFILLLDVCLSLRLGFSMALDGDTKSLALFVLAYAGGAWGLRYLGRFRPRYREICESVGAFLEATALFTLFVPSYIYFSYVAAAFSAPFPYADVHLLAVDKAMGFDWLKYVTWVDNHTAIARLYDLAYDGIGPAELIALFGLLALMRQLRRLYSVILAFFLCATFCIIISSFMPATGIFAYLHLNNGVDFSNASVKSGYWQVDDLNHLRDGSLRHLGVSAFKGMITFPSYHSCIALILAWGAWPIPVVRWLSILANGLMLLAIPVIGGHYLSDMLAGMPIAIITLWALNRYSLKASVMPADK